MLHQIRTVARRTQHTLVEDALGAVALMILLLGSLFLPALP